MYSIFLSRSLLFLLQTAAAIFPLLLSPHWTDTRIININFISSFCVFFSFNLLTGLHTSTYFSFSVCACYILSRFSGQDRAGFDLYHHSRTRLDLCNFYGPSVRISARYKTPNSPFSSRSLWRHSLTLSSANLLLRETSIFKSPEKNQPLITSCAKRQQIYAFYFFFLTAAALNFTDYSARGLTPSLSSLFPLNCALPRAHTNLVSALTSSHSFSR